MLDSFPRPHGGLEAFCWWRCRGRWVGPCSSRCLRKVFSARILLLMCGGQEVFGVRFLSREMGWPVFTCKHGRATNVPPGAAWQIAALGEVCLKGFMGQGAHCQESWCGKVTSCVSRHPALAPALAVKIDAAYGRYFLPGFCC